MISPNAWTKFAKGQLISSPDDMISSCKMKCIIRLVVVLAISDNFGPIYTQIFVDKLHIYYKGLSTMFCLVICRYNTKKYVVIISKYVVIIPYIFSIFIGGAPMGIEHYKISLIINTQFVNLIQTNTQCFEKYN